MNHLKMTIVKLFPESEKVLFHHKKAFWPEI